MFLLLYYKHIEFTTQFWISFSGNASFCYDWFHPSHPNHQPAHQKSLTGSKFIPSITSTRAQPRHTGNLACYPFSHRFITSQAQSSQQQQSSSLFTTGLTVARLSPFIRTIALRWSKCCKTLRSSSGEPAIVQAEKCQAVSGRIVFVLVVADLNVQSCSDKIL